MKKVGRFSKIEGLANKVVNHLLASAVIASTLIISNDCYQKYNINHSETISDRNIEAILKQEKEKIGLQDTPIRVEFFDKNKHASLGTSYCRSDPLVNGYQIVLSSGQKNRGTLRHELYHAYKSDPDKLAYEKPGEIKTEVNEIIREFSANLYAARGIKL